MKSIIHACLVVALTNLGCSTNDTATSEVSNKYIPDDLELYNAIVHMDSALFNAYNSCDMATQSELFSDSIEFYHDQGGLMTSKQDILDATERNICGKVTRELVAGSIEVYPIKDYGAIQIGLHKFHNNQEPAGTPSQIGKFIVIWKERSDSWVITRVISLH